MLNTKNISIELLRVTAMAMVLYMHTLDIAVYDWTADKPFHLNFMSLPEIFCMISSVMAVNIFAMISGYLLCKSEFKISRLLSIYLQTAFYTVGFTVLFAIFSSDAVTIRKWYSAVLAIYSYWYVKSYFALLLLLPILTLAVSYFRSRILFFGILLFIISVFSTFLPGDMFCIYKGYSAIWLSILFVVGGIIRDWENNKALQKVPRFCMALLFLGAVVVNIISYYVLKSLLPSSLQSRVLFALTAYCSPVVIIQSLAFFIFSLQIKIKNTVIQKIILWLGPLSFAVFLIHMNPLVRFNLFQGGFNRFFPHWQNILNLKQYHIIYPAEICAVILIFLVCCFIDFGRLKLFKLCRIPELLQAIDQLPLVKAICQCTEREVSTRTKAQAQSCDCENKNA